MRLLLSLLLLPVFASSLQSQSKADDPKITELVMSMSQRSLVMPGYLTELKALIAKQAYNFWQEGNVDPYVSHLNVYQALYEANKYLGYDSARKLAYNQIGFHSNAVTSVVFGKDPDFYYSSSTDGKVLKWDINNPKSIPETVYESKKIIQSLEISDDGQVLMAIFYQEGLALIPTSKDFKGDISILEDPERIQTATFMPGERKYLSVSKEGQLMMKGFDAEVDSVGKTALTINQIKVDPKSGTIYAGSEEGVLEAWQKPYAVKESPIDDIIGDWKEQSYFGYKLGSFSINCLDVSPNKNILAIGRDRGDVILWNIPGKKLIRIISGHQSTVTDLQFSPDGNKLLTTSRDGTARVWFLSESRKLPIILNDHDDWVLTGSFDPTGDKILTGCGDDFIRAWPVEQSALATRICDYIDRDMTTDEWNEFVGKDFQFEPSCN